MLSTDTDDIEKVLFGFSGDLSLSARSQFFRSALFKAWHQRSVGRRFDVAVTTLVKDRTNITEFNALSSSKDSLDADRLNQYTFCATFIRLTCETATVWLTEDGARLVELLHHLNYQLWFEFISTYVERLWANVHMSRQLCEHHRMSTV